MSYVPYKVRINRINIVGTLLLLSMPKKVKKTLRARLNGKKLLELKHLLNEKNSPNDKNHLKPRDFNLL